jgi:predicted ribosomally synthesized peptide with nif11-like leader
VQYFNTVSVMPSSADSVSLFSIMHARRYAMSRESTSLLIHRLKTDPAFSAQVMAITDPTERLGFLTAAGYAIGPGEFDAYNQELGDTTLNTIAGGGCPQDTQVHRCALMG